MIASNSSQFKLFMCIKPQASQAHVSWKNKRLFLESIILCVTHITVSLSVEIKINLGPKWRKSPKNTTDTQGVCEELIFRFSSRREHGTPVIKRANLIVGTNK